MKVQNVKAFSKRQIGPQAERNQNKKGFRLPKPRQQAVKQITVQQRAQKPQVVGKGRTVPEKQVSRAFSEKHVSCRFQGQASLSVQHDSRHRKYTALAQRYIRRVLRNLRQSTAGSFPLLYVYLLTAEPQIVPALRRVPPPFRENGSESIR